MIRYVQFIQIKYAKHGVFDTKICWLLQRILALSEHFDPSVELKNNTVHQNLISASQN